MSAAKLTTICFLSFAAALPSRADCATITSETSKGSAIFAQALSVDGEFSVHPPDLPNSRFEKSPDNDWAWNFSYAYQESSSTDPTTSVLLVDVSHTIRGAIRFRPHEGMDGGLGLSYGLTPAESLNVIGIDLKTGYTVIREHHSSIHGTLGIGLSEFREIYGRPPAKTSRTQQPSSHVTSLSQLKVAPSLSFKPVQWFRVTAGYSVYAYNVDVPQFVSNLDTPQATRAGLAGFSSTVFGLPLNSANLDFNFYLPEDYEVDIGGLRTVSAADNSIQWSEHFEVGKDITESLTITTGFERDDAPTYFDNVGKISIELGF